MAGIKGTLFLRRVLGLSVGWWFWGIEQLKSLGSFAVGLYLDQLYLWIAQGPAFSTSNHPSDFLIKPIKWLRPNAVDSYGYTELAHGLNCEECSSHTPERFFSKVFQSCPLNFVAPKLIWAFTSPVLRFFCQTVMKWVSLLKDPMQLEDWGLSENQDTEISISAQSFVINVFLFLCW